MNIFLDKIDKSKTICILGHQNPDGDCIGATLAIYNYIKNKYGVEKIVKPFLTEFSTKFNALPNANVITSDTADGTTFDLCIAVDTSNKDRFKDFERYFDDAKDTIVIDHHEHNTVPAKTSIIFENAIATCEILYKFLDKEYIDKNVAMCLYIGIATDSGVFRYRDTSKETFEIAGELISYGFNFTELLDTIVFDNTMQQRKAQGLAFERLKLICNGQVSFSYLNDNDMRELGISKVDIDNIIVYLREICNIKLAAFAYETGHNIYKISLRSKLNKYNVASFAKNHEGGGHALAAGCIYHGEANVVEEHLEKDLNEFIETSKNN